MKKVILIPLAALLFIPSVFAADVCSAPTADAEILNCALQERERAETLLNQQYLAAKKRITSSYASSPKLASEYQQTLLDSQRGWLKYREGQCKLEAFLAEEQTSANQTLVSHCIAHLNKQRINQLKAMPYD